MIWALQSSIHIVWALLLMFAIWLGMAWILSPRGKKWLGSLFRRDFPIRRARPLSATAPEMPSGPTRREALEEAAGKALKNQESPE